MSRTFTCLAFALACALSGCASLVGKATDGFSRNLSAGILDQDDPETVAEGLPAYLLLLDGLIAGDPANAGLLLAAGKLYGSYAGSFVQDPLRRKRLAFRAEDYARRAACASDKPLCAALDAPYDAFAAAVAASKNVALLHGLAVAWASAIQADSENFDRLAALPKVQLLLERVVELDATYDHSSAQMYLGVLDCLRPEALGGNPTRGKARLDQAIAQNAGRNLMPMVLEAQYCARLTYDQELHDRLLEEVRLAPPREPGLTLSNTLAQRIAVELVKSGKDYF
jgi:hypothetical protein